jgi:hypothetical protein
MHHHTAGCPYVDVFHQGHSEQVRVECGARIEFIENQGAENNQALVYLIVSLSGNNLTHLDSFEPLSQWHPGLKAKRKEAQHGGLDLSQEQG